MTKLSTQRPSFAKLFSAISAGVLLALSVASLPSFAAEEKEVTLKTTKVRDNIYMIEGVNGFAGGNVAVSVGEDGVLVIDSLLHSMTDKLSASLAKITSNPVGYLLNTHWHGDHVGGNAKFNGKAAVIAHDNVRKRLKAANKEGLGKPTWPVLTFNDAMTVHFNGDTIKVQHYPSGHTDGDSIIYFEKANVLHMGDDYFNGIFPYVDLKSGGNAVTLASTIGIIIDKMPKDVKIIPGHGALATLDDLKGYHQMLQSSINTVKQGVKSGKSLAEIKKAGLDKSLAAWGGGFIPEPNWIEAIHLSLKQAGSETSSHDHGDGKHHHH